MAVLWLLVVLVLVLVEGSDGEELMIKGNWITIQEQVLRKRSECE